MPTKRLLTVQATISSLFSHGLQNARYGVLALPDGFNTIIGEGGATLCGGERQRISIARAIMKDAPIIILDEATASFFYTQLCA